MLLIDVREAEAEAVGEDGSAPPCPAPGGGGEHTVGGVADGAAGGVRAGEAAERVDELRRVDVLLRLGPPPRRGGFR